MSRERGFVKKKSRRGSLPSQGPFCNLPNEVLAEIFIFLKLSFPYFPCKFNQWSSILLVNRQWRDTARSCPFLWTELEISRNIPDLYLERSCTQPLSLRWIKSDSQDISLSRYSAYLPRARRLYLFGMAQDNETQAFNGINSLPLLEDLTLYPSSLDPLPVTFVCGHFPRLTSLTLCISWPVQLWYTIFSPNLQHLFIDGTLQILPLTAIELLSGLRCMPLLERLQLLNVVPGIEETADLTSESVVARLVRLKHLSLGGSINQCTALLKCLTFPSAANIDICCEVSVDDNGNPLVPDGALPELSEALRDKIVPRDDSEPPLPPMKYLLVQQYEHLNPISGDASGTARLRCMRDDKPFGDSTLENLLFFEDVRRERYQTIREVFQDDLQGVQVLLSWDLTKNTPFEPLPSWPAEICQFLPFEEVTTVALDLDWSTSLMGIARMCPNVTTILGRDEQETEGISSLYYLLDMDEDRCRQNRLHFPKLKTLAVDRVDFGDPSRVYWELELLRETIQDLPTSDKSTIENIYLAIEDPGIGSPIVQDYHAKLSELKTDIPHVNVAMIDYTKSLEWLRV